MLIYLHIPFCHRICPYCAFYKHTPGATPIGRYVEALITEGKRRLAADFHRDLFGTAAPSSPSTLYLGGGTPSMLSPTHLSKLLSGFSEILDFSNLEEITLEANPATFDLKKARLFRELGVQRVSLGIQSFSAPLLKLLGREHTPEQAIESVNLLREAGIPSINIDLMFSLPGLTLKEWEKTLQTAVSLRPDHISAYNLTYEADTPFFESLQRGEMDQNEDRDATQFYLAHDFLTAADFDHYETSNYAKPGHYSRHNHGYWSGKPYLGLGPSAISTLPKIDSSPDFPAAIRLSNIADTARYVSMVEKLGHAVVEQEELDRYDLRLERIALLLRTKKGLPLEWLSPANPAVLIEEGLVEIKDDHLTLTRSGSALVDPIAAQLA